MSWSGTSYCRIHFLPFTRDGRGYAQNAPFMNLWTVPAILGMSNCFFARSSFFGREGACSSRRYSVTDKENFLVAQISTDWCDTQWVTCRLISYVRLVLPTSTLRPTNIPFLLYDTEMLSCPLRPSHVSLCQSCCKLTRLLRSNEWRAHAAPGS